MPELKDRQFLALLKNERDSADSFINSSGIAGQRSKAMKYYQGALLGNEVTGRSQVRSRDVFETVEWILPQLIEMFLGAQNAVEFPPQNANDIAGAEQATDYTNYVVTRQNPAFLIFYDWFKDALLQKTGICKVYWETNLTPRVSNYSNLDEEDLQLLLEPDNVELMELEQTGQVQVVKGGVPQVVPVYSAKVSIRSKDGQVTIEVVPPENFIVRAGTVDLEDTDYCGEIFEATRSDLIASGFEESLVDQVKFDDDTRPFIIGNQVNSARHYLDGSNLAAHVGSSHQSMKKAKITEAYIRVDRDGDGLAELLQVFHDDNVILSIEEVDEIPYIDISAIRIPHKLIGMSVADVIMDLQEIKSVIIRGVLDHMYATINGMYTVVEGAVNVSDILDPIPGGVVRQSAPGMIEALHMPPLDQSTFQLLEYVDRLKEDRAGVNKVQQGVDKSVLGSNVQTGALNTAMRAAQQRIAMIGRLFAETGVKRLFLRVYALIRKHETKEKIIRLRDTFVEVSPFDWQDRADMMVNVGVGNLSAQEKLAEMSMVRDSMLMAQERAPRTVTEENIYNFMAAFAKEIGRRDYAKFFTMPEGPPPPPQPNIDQQIKQQELAIKEREQALKEAEFELEKEKFQWQKVVDVAEVELEGQQKRPVGLQTGK